MDLGQFFSLALAAALCIGGAWICIGRWSRARHLLDTPTSRIRSAAQGYVELVGILRELGVPQPTAPLTDEHCLWWRYCIEEYRSNGKRSSWNVLERGTSEAWLRLADATGECLIDPRGADVHPAFRKVWTGSLRHPRGVAPSGWLGLLSSGKRYRYTEERLHDGEPLYAIGDFRTTGGGRHGLDLSSAKREVIRQWKGDYAGLLQRFDSNADGQLDEQEWNRVHLAARLEAEDRHRQSSAAPEQHQLARPNEALPFVLSSHGEEVITRRFYWQAAGGAAMCLVGAVWLAMQLGITAW
ncbi:GIDE domain-containing protein [Stutzerimonas stutzeri]|uniref:RING-type E3 ubiquitin transferase n=1 Tax=Stutzerimonas stutzeri RCH2 TaxID=644801 RepID=L0GJZ5_STUST|nr:GIDE domain-containing protein [Stutzerimonas stutzeri]AGA85725.1 E3 Ubiquitin ligase [Stutzerimonas stutzeri RCH2]